ncbi:hypothetical protein BUALT_Bualt12G0061800 [Buddleja alternifolia]|uniref:Gag-pol polyprotein n=1 Tax=Buddleja alternifolia TaxID=168488 RepID=A0AAV6WTW8_9LAMI|nr:hypothetical protein BUALT_Bualt12G0061800 [Buddleja alternifolia]
MEDAAEEGMDFPKDPEEGLEEDPEEVPGMIHNNPPYVPAFNQPPNPQARLRWEDLVAIATVVAQVIQGQQNAPVVAQPAIEGTKAHYKTLKRAHVPTFNGNYDPEGAKKWLKEIEDNFELMEIPMEVRPKVVVPILVGEAIAKFDSITQLPDMSVLEYSTKFHSLGKYSPKIMGDPQLKMHKFTKGWKSQIQLALAVFEARKFDELGIQSKECKHCHRVHNGECQWKTGVCFRCGQVGQRVTECKLPENELTKAFVPKTSDAKQNGNARVYFMTEQKADNTKDVVTGTLLINNLPAFVLFDSRSTHSFLSISFTRLMSREAEHVEEPYRVCTPGNKVLIMNLIYKDCSIEIENVRLSANPVQLNMREFDMILGMDWLADNYTHIDCRAKKFDFHPPGRESFSYQENV